MRPSKRLLALALPVFFVVVAVALTSAKQEPQPWVAVNVTEPLVRSGGLKQFQVYFAMQNDSKIAIDPKAGSWRLNVNATDHPDSQFTFANGPRDDRWESLPAGDYLLFGLEISQRRSRLYPSRPIELLQSSSLPKQEP